MYREIHSKVYLTLFFCFFFRRWDGIQWRHFPHPGPATWGNAGTCHTFLWESRQVSTGGPQRFPPSKAVSYNYGMRYREFLILPSINLNSVIPPFCITSLQRWLAISDIMSWQNIFHKWQLSENKREILYSLKYVFAS